MRRVVFLLAVLVCASAAFGQRATEGSLYAVGKSGKELGACPLKNTDVNVEISGFMARVNVKQEFVNSYSQAIEAVYMFPLSQNGAVDRMTMTVGDRVVRGKIMRKEEARETYETAKSEGKTASLLDQEQPNIFKQSVANIMPGERVVIDISYVETLKYEDGAYEFVFPMVVAPRYGGRNASQALPPVARVRNGSNISIEVDLNAGVPVEQIRSISHRIKQTNFTPNKAKVTLAEGKTIPNKDFILRYDVTGKRIEDAVLTHSDAKGGFFTMILQPPDIPAPEDRTPKEVVFVLDTSGSMDGFPIEKAKEAMRLSLDGLYPDDMFNLITFAGDTEVLFPQPVPATRSNLDKAHAFIAGRQGEGGTEMMGAIKASLDPSDSQEHLRIVCFMTDGQVGNDDEIVAEVQKHPRARVFSFGIGDSVNRSLLDRIAQEGKGEATYIALADDGSKAARKFYERVRTPLLTDLSIDWNGMPVADVYPEKLTDLFSAKPVVVHGRYTKPASGKIKLRGFVAGQPYEREIDFKLPENEEANDALRSLWARTRIGELANRKLNSEDSDALDREISQLGLEYGLMSEFTSFVAVEERIVNQNGKPVTVVVPLERPAASQGEDEGDSVEEFAVKQPPPATQGKRKAKKNSARFGDPNGRLAGNASGTGRGSGMGSGTASGSGGGLGSGVGNGNSAAMVNAPANVDSVTLSVVSADGSPPPPSAKLHVAATVEVTSSVEVINATDASIGTTFTTRQINALPLQARSFSSLMALTPGATTGDEVRNTFQIDGASLSDAINSEGRVVLAVKPDSPGVGSGRNVPVAIEVDAFGAVVTANASGPVELRRASEAAARITRFAPATTSDGKPLRLKGTIVYRFEKGRKVNVGLREMKAIPATEADMRLVRLGDKLHFWLADVVRRIQIGNQVAGGNEAKFVTAGRASVKVKLKDRSPVAIARLKAAGFEIVRESGKSNVEGRIAIEKIASLADIDEVVLITPKI